MKKFIHFLKYLPPVLFKITIGGFIVISVAMFFQSCITSFDAEKVHFKGNVVKPRLVIDSIH